MAPSVGQSITAGIKYIFVRGLVGSQGSHNIILKKGLLIYLKQICKSNSFKYWLFREQKMSYVLGHNILDITFQDFGNVSFHHN